MNPLESWNEEQRSAYLYKVCADTEAGTVRGELFRRLAGEALAQAAIWRAQLTARGHPPPGPFLADSRTRLVAAAMIPLLLGATAVHAGNGWVFSGANGGWEYPAYLVIAALAQSLLGSGILALDKKRVAAV